MAATIKLGSVGKDVETWQGLLTSAGYAVPTSGVFDEATKQQTIAWQKAKFSNPTDWDGIVGPMSWGAMTGAGSTQEVAPGDVAGDIAAVPGLAEHTDNAFRYAVAQMAARLKTNPDFIVAAMAVETVKTFSPTAENPLSHAIGLIQFMPNGSAASLTGKAHGIGPGSGFEYLKSLSPIEQLEYVEKYFKPFTGKMNNPSDAYLAVFFPSAMGKPADHHIADEGTKVYEQNKGFDSAKKGYITAGDVGKAAQGMLNAASKVPRIPITPEGGGPLVPSLPSDLSIVPKVGAVGLLLVGAFYLWRWWSGR